MEDGAYEAALGLAWLSQDGCSPVLRLLTAHGPEKLWQAPAETLVGWGLSRAVVGRLERKRESFSPSLAREILQVAGVVFIPFRSHLYPAELAQLSHPPAGLFSRGALCRLEHLVHAPRVTVVGTRRSTPYGNRVTESLAMAFSRRAIVVSGLALGIDGRAHQAALDAGGMTCAILGCGVDVVYPARHQGLYTRIRDDGVLLSELPPGVRPARWTFPHRNRLLAALGDAVVVVEGARTSGALQTAEAALELGRPVFAVPGPITSAGHQGCNWLIYDGASPVIDPCVTVEEFLLATRIERKDRPLAEVRRVGPRPPGTDVAEKPCHASIREALTEGPCSIDGLALHTRLPPREVAVALAELEIRGAVVRTGGGFYIRAP